ncbi:CoA ester lyase [Aurantimonas sp. VKM B-3413]|uniref:HpcH/HpaI aldolase/citrate lyase family protein n=1 Tax=Aurantimonas sp. VKM B-3413 TaxID=2779401 RepID=UPI001E532A95|nr:CoA ester lyase [Aurantimonas sp. VKM B-3413]MCB8837711.1 CoA ester lyase [Aurantimonas sp. VKM B-3413]
MTAIPRPRRSLLFVPGSNARALQKSGTLAADGLIFDLEDSVGAAEKDDAREKLRLHLAETKVSGERIVRINGLDTASGTEDLLMARGAGVDAILLPKVESPAVIHQAAAALDDMDAPAHFAIWAMIETPRGILEADRIAAEGAERRLAAFVVGPNDIQLATRIAPQSDRSELLPWLMQIVLAARSSGLAVLDGVFADLGDPDGFAAECAAGRRMGFDGKTLIHPSQVEPANAAFGPSPEALAAAEAVVAAFAEPANAARGVIQIDGRMVERLHLEEARRLLALRDMILRREQKGTR